VEGKGLRRKEGPQTEGKVGPSPSSGARDLLGQWARMRSPVKKAQIAKEVLVGKVERRGKSLQIFEKKEKKGGGGGEEGGRSEGWK